MNQVVKDKMERQITVIPTKEVNKIIDWKEWFIQYENAQEIFNKLNHYTTLMKRWEAEINPDFKQQIPYWIIIKWDKIFVYKRWGKNSNAWESRLHNKVSIWVWGHIEWNDVYDIIIRKDKNKENIDLTLVGLLREMEEEINLKSDNIKDIKAIGIINDNSNEVWKVHLWFVYFVEVDDDFVPKMEDWELANWEFMNKDELRNLLDNPDYEVENWSKLIIEKI